MNLSDMYANLKKNNIKNLVKQYEKEVRKMKKKFNFKAKLIGAALLAAGVTAAAPIAVPTAVMAQETAGTNGSQSITIPFGCSYRTEEKTIRRTAHYMYREADGSTTPIPSTEEGKNLERWSQVTMQKITVFNKKTGATVKTYYSDPVEFPAWESPDIYGYAPDKEVIPAKTFTWDDESEDVYVYYTRDESRESIETKEFTRTIYTTYKDTDGSVIKEYTEPQTLELQRYVWTDKNGNKTYGDWGTATAKKMDVPVVNGYKANMTEVPEVVITSPDDTFEDVHIVYTKRPYKTEKKEITRKINLIGNNNDGTTTYLEGQTQKVTLSRTVYTDTNGVEEVRTDWQTGTLPQYNVPDKNGYTKLQSTVPALKVDGSSESTEVNVYYNAIQKTFTVMYHLDDASSASDKTTNVNYGTLTNTLSLSELGFSKANHTFKGWKAYRECDDTWYMRDRNGNKAFKKLVNGQLPAGHSFILYKNAEAVKATAPSGIVHFYGQWEQRRFIVRYHADDFGVASNRLTSVNYGTLTKTLTISELGFSKANHTFKGWKAYRECDDTWYMRDSNGNKAFKKLVNGQLPEGHSFILYKNGESVKATAPEGEVHFYAQWEQMRFTVKYHCDDTIAASDKTTTVNVGTLTPTLTLSELGFSNDGKTFAGWKAYREVDDTWYMKDSNGNKAYKKLVNGELPEGHSFILYKNGESVKATAPSGFVHFYAQWK